MGWKQKASSGGGNFEACPAGNHAAVLIAIIDLGTQEDSYQGVERTSRKVFLCWEIPGEQTAAGRSHVIGREYTLSFNEKAGLRKLIEAWRGKSFTEGEEFDLSALLGKPCMLTVVTEDKNGKTYAKINGVSSMPKGMPVPTATLGKISFSLEEDDRAKFPDADWLPWSYGSKLIDIAKKSPEWNEQPVGASAQADEAPF